MGGGSNPDISRGNYSDSFNSRLIRRYRHKRLLLMIRRDFPDSLHSLARLC